METSRLAKRLLSIFLVTFFSLAAAAQAATYQASSNPALFGHLSQQDPLMTPTFGNFGCSVTSVVNSLVYLQKKFPGIYGTKLVASYDTATLANTAIILGTPTYLNFNLASGVSWADYYWGTYLYIEANVPHRSRYLGEDNVANSWTLDRPRLAWVSEYQNSGDFPTNPPSYPTWQFLYHELQQQHAVLIHWNAHNGDYKHYMTLTGIYFNDVNNNGIIPKDLTGNTANITFVDPKDGNIYTAPIWTRTIGPPADGGLMMYYTNPVWWTGNALIDMAMSVIPIPSPLSALSLLLLD